MAKKNLNWTEIRARYESGEPPRSIAKDFKNCDGKMISNKASREGWVGKKREKQEEIVKSSHLAQKSQLEELCSLTETIHLLCLRKMTEPRDDGTCMLDDFNNALLFDGEKVNGLFQTVLKNAVQIYQSKMKLAGGEGEGTDFTLNIRRGSDASAQPDPE